MKEIIINNELIYQINFNTNIALDCLYKIIDWMEKHSASYSGEAIMQNDNTIIDAPELIANIIDNILKPKFISEI